MLKRNDLLPIKNAITVLALNFPPAAIAAKTLFSENVE